MGKHAAEPALTARTRRRRRTRGAGLRHDRRGLAGLAVAMLVGAASTGGMVLHGTSAAFSGSATNASNTWATGTVSFTDDDSGTAMFNLSNLVPGSTGSKCIKLTYTGNVGTGLAASAGVKIYSALTAGSATLAGYVDLVIERVDAGTFASCGTVNVQQLVFSGTLNSLTTTKTSYSNGAVSGWAPSTNGSVQVFRITYTLNASTPTGQQGQTCTASFTWEAQA